MVLCSSNPPFEGENHDVLGLVGLSECFIAAHKALPLLRVWKSLIKSVLIKEGGGEDSCVQQK